MKILFINSVCGTGSTGRICTDLAADLERAGHETVIAYGRGTVPEWYQGKTYRIGSNLDVTIHGVKARLMDASGFGSRKATEKLVKFIQEYDPDVIHLHNIHGYYLNIEVLFKYLRYCKKKILWTLHDCWAFTGRTAFCELVDCEKWETGCSHCPLLKEYPVSYTDHSQQNWHRKKDIFTGVQNMQMVVPSQWLKGLVERSYLQEYPVQVIKNGIDLSVFSPADTDLRDRRKIGDKKVLLGVANVWESRKGLTDFIKLASLVGEDYQIVLVGVSEKQQKELPNNIISVSRTDSVQELVEYYSMADFFLNLTYEDNYPTTNLEAIACGTPVVSYDTGGSGESARLYGTVVSKGNLQGVLRAVRGTYTCEPGYYELIDKKKTIQRYLALYQPIE